MVLCTVLSAGLAACGSEDGGTGRPGDAAHDAGEPDAPVGDAMTGDTGTTGDASLDAPGDASGDGAWTDAAQDAGDGSSEGDASLDGQPDADPDATAAADGDLDATADVSVDATVDAGDATADAPSDTPGDASQDGADAPSDAPGDASDDVAADAGCDTTVSGVVYAPNGVTPLYNAVVYVPQGTVPPLPAGSTCDQCGAGLGGSVGPLTTTAQDGSFTLSNVPPGVVTLVIRLGKWRRTINVASVSPCGDTVLPAEQTRLPQAKSEGDLPKIAVLTGAHDGVECILRRIGIAADEFGNSSGTAAVHLYRSNGSFHQTGASIGDSAEQLLGDLPRMKSYDLIVFGCEGAAFASLKTVSRKNNLRSYLDAGGRAFMTHFAYAWLHDYSPFSAAAPWNVNQPFPTATPVGGQLPLTAAVDTSFHKGNVFAQWLGGAQVSLLQSRHDVDDVVVSNYGSQAPWPASFASRRWVHSAPTLSPDKPKGTVQLLTLNLPWGQPPALQCGRLVFSDFHLAGYSALTATCTNDASCSTGQRCLVSDLVSGTKACTQTFASACPAGPLSEQERPLAFLLFDAVDCVGDDASPPPPPPSCEPTTCAAQGKNCGQISDGCAAVLDCGACFSGQTCGGGGVANVCGVCQPIPCATLGANCGLTGDGCGGVQYCGDCTPPAVCGGNVCG